MILRHLAYGLLATLLAAPPAVAQSSNLAIGMKLEDAGFKMREANTPDKMARLNSIPPHKFVPHRKNGVRYYVYADPTYCNCAFVGDQTAMNAYRNMPPVPQPDNVSRDRGGINLEDEMQNEMDDESGTNFDDIFHPGF